MSEQNPYQILVYTKFTDLSILLTVIVYQMVSFELHRFLMTMWENLANLYKFKFGDVVL